MDLLTNLALGFSVALPPTTLCLAVIGCILGTMMAYTESAWSPHKGSNNGQDMQWGGGTLFVDNAERADTDTGGRRKLAVRNKVIV